MKIIKNKSGAMKPSSYLLMALAISLIVVGVFMVIGEFQTNYPDITVNETWKPLYEKAMNITRDINSSATDIREKTAGLEEAEGFFETAFAATIAGIALVSFTGKLVLQGIGGVISIVTTAFTEAGVPAVVVGVIITALVIIIVFGIVSMIWKYREV